MRVIISFCEFFHPHDQKVLKTSVSFVVSTSKDGVTWSPFEYVTGMNSKGEYMEKGPELIWLRNEDNSDYQFSIVYKSNENGWNLWQTFFNF